MRETKFNRECFKIMSELKCTRGKNKYILSIRSDVLKDVWENSQLIEKFSTIRESKRKTRVNN